MSRENFMLDLETYDTIESSVVLSIGVVPFDQDSISHERFHAVMAFDINSQVAAGRTTSEETVKWWSEQSPEAREIFKMGHTNAMRTVNALEDLPKFLGASPRVWGNGSDFDNAILRSLYTSFELKCPWHYTGNRCFRTLKALAKVDIPKRDGVKHNALEDALFQAHWAMVICQKLGIQL